ncbi:MAG: winged helix-turn-helix domain-containing protein [Candidatus Melainabacteria bacterium]|nr:winged helix-turn-helix domain-containing protein [Candidatus Melainabacteria bacterium]
MQENHYLQIHQFLRENPGSTIEQIAEGTGISLETIQQLHRSGYFQEKRGICAQCKKLTPGGDSVSICRDCRSKVTKELLDTRGISHQEMADNLKQGLKSNRNRSSEKQYGLRSE